MMISTVEQAEAAIIRIESKENITHHERVIADALREAIRQAKVHAEWEKQISEYDRHGDATMRDQHSRNLEEWIDTRMSATARRMVGA